MSDTFFWSIVLAISLAADFLVAKGNYGLLPFGIWLLAIFLTIGLAINKISSFPREKSKELKTAKYSFFVLLFLLLIYGFRLALLFNPKAVFFHGDEAIISRVAEKAFKDAFQKGKWEILGYQQGTICYFPSLWYYLQGAIINFLGPSIFSVKFFSLMTDFGISLLIFFLMKEWFNKMVAFGAVMVYSTLPIAIHFGATGYQNIQSTFFLFLSLWFLTKGVNKGVKEWFLLAGLSCGLGMYFYLSSVLSPVIIIIALIFIYRRSLFNLPKPLLLFLFGFVLVSGPFFAFSLTNYNFLTGRSSVFDLWQDASLWGLFFSQIKKYFEGFYFGFMNGSGRFYLDLPAIPSFFLFLFFLGGFFWTLWEARKRWPFLVIFLVFGMTSFFGGILTENPPAPQRLIHIFPVLAIEIALGIYLAFLLGEKIFKQRHLSNLLFLVLCFLSVIINLLSFCQKNLPAYYLSPVSQSERAFVNLYFKNFLLKGRAADSVLVHIPIHKIDQIYFYSRGLIVPEPVFFKVEGGEVMGSSSEGIRTLYLTDEEGKLFLEKWESYEQLEWNGGNETSLFWGEIN